MVKNGFPLETVGDMSIPSVMLCLSSILKLESHTQISFVTGINLGVWGKENDIKNFIKSVR